MVNTPNYTMKTGKSNNLLYDRYGNAVYIIEVSPSITKLFFKEGEVELNVSDTELTASSKFYSDDNEKKSITKTLIKGYLPIWALGNAKRNIVNRVINLGVEAIWGAPHREESVPYTKKKERANPQEMRTFNILGGEVQMLAEEI